MFDNKLLKKLRKQKQKVKLEASKEIKERFNYNISPTTLWRFETGKSSPQVKDLKILAKYYGVKIEDFFKKGLNGII